MFRAALVALGLATGAVPFRAVTLAADQAAPSAQPALKEPAEPRAIPELPPATIVSPDAAGGPAAVAVPAAPSAVISEIPCDYWIVSSRHCKGKLTGTEAGCLNFIHRTSERTLTNYPREAFLASLRPDQPVCFVVHGSYNWWRDVVNESRRIHRWICGASPGVPVQVVFFTWPSDGNMPFVFPIDIAILGRKASSHSIYLANLIGHLPPEQPVCIMGHSHGARSAVAALHLLGGGAVEDGQRLPPGYSTPEHLRAVLIAAAIDHDWLNPGERYGNALLTPERVLLMRNSRDTTLAVYPFRKIGGGRAMGKAGLGLDDRFQMDQMGMKVVELDASQFAGANHSFADYHEHPELAAALVPYVYFHESVVAAPPAAAASGRQEVGAASPVTPGTGAASGAASPQPIMPRLAAPQASSAPEAATAGAEDIGKPQPIVPATGKAPEVQGAGSASPEYASPQPIMPRLAVPQAASGDEAEPAEARDEGRLQPIAPATGKPAELKGPRLAPISLTPAPAADETPRGRTVKIQPRKQTSAAKAPKEADRRDAAPAEPAAAKRTSLESGGKVPASKEAAPKRSGAAPSAAQPILPKKKRLNPLQLWLEP